MSRPHSLRLRLLGVMFALFTLGLAASFAEYRFEVHDILEGLHARTLQNQARELIDALRPAPGGALDVRLHADWRQVYADHSRQFTFTVFGPDHRPRAWSANLSRPLPTFRWMRAVRSARWSSSEWEPTNSRSSRPAPRAGTPWSWPGAT